MNRTTLMPALGSLWGNVDDERHVVCVVGHGTDMKGRTLVIADWGEGAELSVWEIGKWLGKWEPIV